MPERLNHFRVMIEVVETAYSNMADPTAKWPKDVLKQLLFVAGQQRSDSDRLVHLAVRAMLTLTEGERNAFSEEVEIPAAVLRNLDTDPEWPMPLPAAGWEALDELDVATYRTYAQNVVESETRAVRLMLVTDLPGQDMLYLRKEMEADSYLALSEEPADLTDFPLMAAEVGVTAPSALELAGLWSDMSVAWRAAAGPLENARMTAKNAIDEAETAQAITAALDAFRAAIAG